MFESFCPSHEIDDSFYCGVLSFATPDLLLSGHLHYTGSSLSFDPSHLAVSDELDAGFLCLKETGKDTVELAVMGVLKKYHRKGLGRKLFEAARKVAAEEGYSFMQVKTVKMGMYEDYDITNRFYLSCGFKEFEVITELWGEENPCQIYVMSLLK